jgi:hypothetical protein
MSRFVFWPTPPQMLESAVPLYAELAVARMRLALVKLALKYRPDQPRVPTGNRDGGRWMGAGGDYSRIAANDSRKPPSVIVTPMYGADLLDPKNINTPPSPTDLKQIQSTLDKLSRGSMDDLKQLAPKAYSNYPSRLTGAMLPPSVAGYTSFAVGSRGLSRRLIVDNATGATYYTNNHYASFYHVR